MAVSRPTRERLVSLLFVIGGSCFALASTPAASAVVPTEAIGVTYAVGAVFFTSAAFTQLSLAWRDMWSTDWWACAIQFIGTVAFNVTTLRALDESLTTHEELLTIWYPDVYGSICFLVASVLALLVQTSDGRRMWAAPQLMDARIAWWNMVGSVLFGVAAFAGRYVGDSTEVADVVVMNAATMWGAICFVIGARMLRLPAR